MKTGIKIITWIIVAGGILLMVLACSIHVHVYERERVLPNEPDTLHLIGDRWNNQSRIIIIEREVGEIPDGRNTRNYDVLPLPGEDNK